MPRPQDILFGILGLGLVALLRWTSRSCAGAFRRVCLRLIYVFAGMIPSRNEGFWHRLFITVFLALVMSSLVLILPGTFGAHAVGQTSEDGHCRRRRAPDRRDLF